MNTVIRATVAPWRISPDLGSDHIRRTLVIDVETFDAFKAWERKLSATMNRKLANGEVLRMLVLSRPVESIADPMFTT